MATLEPLKIGFPQTPHHPTNSALPPAVALPLKVNPDIEAALDSVMKKVAVHASSIQDEQLKLEQAGRAYTWDEANKRVRELIEIFYDSAKGTALDRILPQRSASASNYYRDIYNFCRVNGYHFDVHLLDSGSDERFLSLAVLKIKSVEFFDLASLDTGGIPLPEHKRAKVLRVAEPLLDYNGGRKLGGTVPGFDPPLIVLYDDEIGKVAREMGVVKAELDLSTKLHEVGHFITHQLWKNAKKQPGVAGQSIASGDGTAVSLRSVDEAYSNYLAVKNSPYSVVDPLFISDPNLRTNDDWSFGRRLRCRHLTKQERNSQSRRVQRIISPMAGGSAFFVIISMRNLKPIKFTKIAS